MNFLLLITLEILLIIVAPLIFLYLRGPWPLRNTIPCMVSIPVLWYPTYSPLHELSHVAGTYLAGGKVTYVKLIPKFWIGEVARAWITTDGIIESWQQLFCTGSPYILDVLCIVAGLWFLRRDFSKSAFVVGLVFMLLCLRPSFDLVCETIAFVSGNRGDIYFIDQILGSFLTRSFLVLSTGLSILAIVVVLRRFNALPPKTTPAAT